LLKRKLKTYPRRLYNGKSQSCIQRHGTYRQERDARHRGLSTATKSRSSPATTSFPPAEIAAGLPKDSIHGKFPVDVKLIDDKTIQVGDDKMTVYAEKDANNIPWGKHNVDVVLECTGFYLSTEKSHGPHQRRRQESDHLRSL
jgi:hypothetical protein